MHTVTRSLQLDDFSMMQEPVQDSTSGNIVTDYPAPVLEWPVRSVDDGTFDSSMTFYPFGSARSGSVNTDKQFTGQRLDGTGLYYYGARYYDPVIGHAHRAILW
jgi:hypothetical protein